MKSFLRFGAYVVAFVAVLSVAGFGLRELLGSRNSDDQRAVLSTPPPVAPSPSAAPEFPPSAPVASSADAPATLAPASPAASPAATLALPPSAPVASSADAPAGLAPASSAASPAATLALPRSAPVASSAPAPAAPAASAISPSSSAAFDDEAARMKRADAARRLEAEMSRLEAREREQREGQVAMATARPFDAEMRRHSSAALREAAIRDEKENKDELEHFFPWPPPPSTARVTYANIFADRKRFSNIAQAASFLEHKLAEAGFARQWSYFKLPDEKAGFGLVSKMEQIDPKTARRLPGTQGWTTDRVASASDMAWWNWGFAIQRPVGEYRVFVLIVSTRPTPDKPAKDLRENEKATFFRAQEWVSGGRGSLTSDIASLPLTANHALTVRLYEFRQQDKGTANFVPSSPLPLEQHLAGAGINLEPQR